MPQSVVEREIGSNYTFEAPNIASSRIFLHNPSFPQFSNYNKYMEHQHFFFLFAFVNSISYSMWFTDKIITSKLELSVNKFFPFFFLKRKGEKEKNQSELEEPETLGEVTGNSGKRRGSASLGVLAGDGCK